MLKNLILFITLLLMGLAMVATVSCQSEKSAGVKPSIPSTSKPTSTSAASSSPTITSGKFDDKSVLKETQAFIDKFSKDLSEGKVESVLNQLESPMKQQLAGSLDLSSPSAKKLAEALARGKSTDVQPTIVFYETSIDGEAISFYIIKEAGQWKLGGL
jgi:hypothetical protein